MSVYTTVSQEELTNWLSNYDLGELTEYEGISSGIENTNYFVTTTKGQFVLTLFEKLTHDELPWFLELMDHLSHHNVPCPMPIHARDDAFLRTLNDKPACLVTRLKGRSIFTPSVEQCAELGEVLARLHLASQSFGNAQQMPNPRGQNWRMQTAPKVMPHLSSFDAERLAQEVSFQSDFDDLSLPRGVVHADLFRDNAMFHEQHLSGLIDFYFACYDIFLYDVAITLNDWCLTEAGLPDTAKVQAFVRAYHRIRPFTQEELPHWNKMLRAGALRFWLSRLYDYYYPREGELTHAKDPTWFGNLLAHYNTDHGLLDLKTLLA